MSGSTTDHDVSLTSGCALEVSGRVKVVSGCVKVVSGCVKVFSGCAREASVVSGCVGVFFCLLYYTRYLPLREVQQQQLKSPVDSNKANTRSLTPFEFLFNSFYALPLLVVLCVVVILLVCRRKRPSLRSYPTSPQGLLLSRSVSQASFLKVHRRTSSVNNPSTLLGSLSRNQSSGRLSAIV